MSFSLAAVMGAHGLPDATRPAPEPAGGWIISDRGRKRSPSSHDVIGGEPAGLIGISHLDPECNDPRARHRRFGEHYLPPRDCDGASLSVMGVVGFWRFWSKNCVCLPVTPMASELRRNH
jgi:hypothetical protein